MKRLIPLIPVPIRIAATGVVLLSLIACANEIATISPDPATPIVPMTAADAQIFYDTYLKPQITSQVSAEVGSLVSSAIVASEQRTWQRMAAADAENAKLLETTMLQYMRAGIDARLAQLGQPQQVSQ